MSEPSPSPEAVVKRLGHARASAIVRCADGGLAADAMERAITAGFDVVEFTLTIPGALELVRTFSARPELLVGAGTVLEPADAEAAIAAGAEFLVSPIVDEAVIEVAGEAGVAMMPGAASPTELLRAHRAGAPLLKLFPAPAGGPVWLRSLLGPLPFLKIVPTNGVDAGNVAEWLDAGAWAAGFAATLFEPSALARRDLDAVEQRARDILAAVAKWRRDSAGPAV